MTDIDFDELDKAVNSLMGKAAPKKTEEEERRAKTLNINETLGPDEKPTYNKIEAAAKRIGSETLLSDDERLVVEELDKPEVTNQPGSPLSETAQTVTQPESQQTLPPSAVKRPDTGRFMDVVHPSSDMRTANAPNLVIPERQINEPQVSQPDTQPQVATPAPTVSAPTPQVTADDKNQPAGSPPSLSPFLPDAKVEKRPLGGASASTDATSASSDNSQETPEESVAPSSESNAIATAAKEQSQPAQEIVAINSEVPMDDKSSDEQRALNPTDFEKELSPVEAELHKLESHEAAVPGPTHEDVRAVESGDTEKLTSGIAWESINTDDNNDVNAIYDVNEYHQLNHPPKQKSGWGVVIIIVVIIAICSSIGAAAYFIVTSGS